MLRLRKPPPPRVPLVAAGGIQIKDDGQSCATPISLLELIGYSVFQVLRTIKQKTRRGNLFKDAKNKTSRVHLRSLVVMLLACHPVLLIMP